LNLMGSSMVSKSTKYILVPARDGVTLLLQPAKRIVNAINKIFFYYSLLVIN
jgi:hypothetical protein